MFDTLYMLTVWPPEWLPEKSRYHLNKWNNRTIKVISSLLIPGGQWQNYWFQREQIEAHQISDACKENIKRDTKA